MCACIHEYHVCPRKPEVGTGSLGAGATSGFGHMTWMMRPKFGSCWKGNWAISLAPQLSSWRPMACMNFKGNCTKENCVQYHMLAEGGYGITNKNVSEKNGLWKNLPMQLTKISKWIKGEQVETITFVPLYLFTFSEGTCFFVLETCCVSTGTGISF